MKPQEMVAAGACLPQISIDQSYPVKSIRTIVTFAGDGEALCRMVAQNKDFTPITLAWETEAIVAIYPSRPAHSN